MKMKKKWQNHEIYVLHGSPGVSARPVLIVLLVVFAFFGVFFFFRNRTRRVQTLPSPTPLVEQVKLPPPPSPSPFASPLPPIVSVAETARLPHDIIWTTFSDPVLQFSIQYPAVWFPHYAKNEDDESSIYSYVTPRFPGKENLVRNELIVTFLRYTEEEERNLPQIPEQNIISTSDVTVGGVSGKRTEWRYPNSSGRLIVLHRNGYVYHINAIPSDSAKMNIFDLMIGTFSFSQ